jgi:hypothetical protein
MSGLIVLSPLAITPAMLTATDVAEADYPAIANGHAYALADRVISTATHKIYECVLAYNSATPAIAPDLDATHWLVVSATNRWKLFDGANSTRTAKADSFYFEITPGMAIPALYLDSIVGASSVRVRMTDPVYGLVYDTGLVSLAGLPAAADWWEWLFGLWSPNASSYTLTELPSFPNAVIRVDVTGGADLAVGTLLLGPALEFGRGVRYGASSGIKDYTTKDVNRWGDTVVTPGEYAKRGRFTVQLTPDEIDSIQEFLAGVRAIPCLYIAYRPIGAFNVFGYYEGFEIVMPGPRQALCEVTVQGVT